VTNSILFIITTQPYDGSDTVYNALRLANTLTKSGKSVNIFLMGDAVDLARESSKKPEFYDQDLVSILKGLIEKGVVVEACGTCMARCGLYKNEPYFDGVAKSTMQRLSELVVSCEKVLNF